MQHGVSTEHASPRGGLAAAGEKEEEGVHANVSSGFAKVQ
jgi:hypothetical protein